MLVLDKIKKILFNKFDIRSIPTLHFHKSYVHIFHEKTVENNVI